MIGVINLITSIIPTQPAQPPQPAQPAQPAQPTQPAQPAQPTQADTTEPARKRYSPDSADGRKVKEFGRWVTNEANPTVSDKIDSLSDPQPLFTAQDQVIAAACANRQLANWSNILTIARGGELSPEDARILREFYKWVNNGDGANKKVSTMIDSLLDEQPLFDAQDVVIADACANSQLANWSDIVNAAFLPNSLAGITSFEKDNQLRLSFGINPNGDLASNPAVDAELLPSTTGTIEAGVDYTPFKLSFLNNTFHLSLPQLSASYTGSFINTKNHQLRLSADAMLKVTPLKDKNYLRIFGSFGSAIKLDKFKSPTLFYPNAKNPSIKTRIGGGTDLRGTGWGFGIAAAVTHKYSWLNHELPNYIGVDNFKFGGNEEELNLDIAVTADLGEIVGSSSGWLPDATLTLQIPIRGQTNVPNLRTLNNEVIYHHQDVINAKQFKFDASLEFSPLSLFGGYSNRSIQDWPNEKSGYAGVSFDLAGTPASASYIYSKLDPSNPIETHGAQVSWTLPFLDGAFTPSTYFHVPTSNSKGGIIWGIRVSWAPEKTFGGELPSFTFNIDPAAPDQLEPAETTEEENVVDATDTTEAPEAPAPAPEDSTADAIKNLDLSTL